MTGQRTQLLRFLALNDQYSIYKKFSRFVPTRINMMQLQAGVENVVVVRNYL